MTDTVESTEKIDKISSIMVDQVKTLVQIATLDLEKLGEAGAVLKNISIAADVLKIHVDILTNGVKTAYVIGNKETDNIEYTSGMIKSFLSVMQRNAADAVKEIVLVNVSDESDKLTTELIGSVFSALNSALYTKDFKIDPKSILIDYYAIGVKAAVKAFLSTHLASKRSNAETYQFAYDYLDAYYKSGGDSVFMLQQPVPMPFNLFDAVSRKVNNDWLEVVIGNLPFGGDSNVFTKRMHAINLVKKYMNQVESTYLDIGSAFGGFPKDDLFIKFVNPNERFICAGGYAQDELLVIENIFNNKLTTPTALEWTTDSDVGISAFGNLVQLEFKNVGLYPFFAKARKTPGSSVATSGKNYFVTQCVAPNTEIENGGFKIIENDASGMTFERLEMPGFYFLGWFDTSETDRVAVSQEPRLRINYANYFDYASYQSSTLTPRFSKSGPPILNTPIVGDGQVTLNWTPVIGNFGYEVFISYSDSINTSDSSTYISRAPIDQTSTPIHGLENGRTYYFGVTAIIGEEATDISNIVSAIPQAETDPNIPSGDCVPPSYFSLLYFYFVTCQVP
jgi:hypothetical protein